MNSLRPIANRADGGQFALPADGMYQLIPVGEYPHPESGLSQILDGPAMTAIVNRFQKESAAPNFAGLRVDYDHFSYEADKPSAAAGWIMRMENRADGVWGEIKWTASGEADVKGGNYRFLSPTWLPSEVEKLPNKRIRPLRMDSAAVTNNPNLRGMKPLSNRDADAPSDHPQPQKNRMKQLLTALGLSGDAAEESALAELAKLKNRVTQAEQALEPLTNRVKEVEKERDALKTANATLAEAVVEQDLAKYANRFKPEAKDAWKAGLLGNRTATLQLLDSLPEPTAAADPAAGSKTPVHNRDKAKIPAASPDKAAEAAEAAETARAAKIRNRASEIARQPGMTFQVAWQMAAQELG